MRCGGDRRLDQPGQRKARLTCGVPQPGTAAWSPACRDDQEHVVDAVARDAGGFASDLAQRRRDQFGDPDQATVNGYLPGADAQRGDNQPVRIRGGMPPRLGTDRDVGAADVNGAGQCETTVERQHRRAAVGPRQHRPGGHGAVIDRQAWIHVRQ